MPTPWAVVNCSVGASEEVKALKRVIAGEIFERVLFVDDIFLLAVGLAEEALAAVNLLSLIHI